MNYNALLDCPYPFEDISEMPYYAEKISRLFLKLHPTKEASQFLINSEIKIHPPTLMSWSLVG